MTSKALRIIFVLVLVQVMCKINLFRQPILNFSFLKVWTDSLAAPANVADKIGEKGMDLGRMVGSHILDKIDEMIPDEEHATKRSDDIIRLAKEALDSATANIPLS